MPVYFKKLGEFGKLGNALFQASCTIALAKRNNDSYFFPASWKYKNSFNFPPNCFTNNIRPSFTYEELYFHYSEITYKQNINLLGYFQSYKYWLGHESDIRHLLKTQYNIQPLLDTTSIHVRRTDYLNFPNHHPILTMDYYHKAMEISGSHKFLVFSDDIAWCKQYFIGNHFEFSEGNNEVYDLILQSKCANNIIANSSYSWWGGWLNENSNKIIIAPKKWFGPALSMHNTKDLYCPGWLVI